jgi:hypothetical protein
MAYIALAKSQAQHLDADRRAAAAEAKLEQFTESAVINVVHSQAVQDGGEDDRSWWKFWRR